jgi:hypothetical protein
MPAQIGLPAPLCHPSPLHASASASRFGTLLQPSSRQIAEHVGADDKTIEKYRSTSAELTR